MTRERTRNSENWKINKKKALTAQGKAHVNWRGKAIPEKTIKTTKDCALKCKFQCASIVSDDVNQTIFDTFYKMSTEQQRFFVLSTSACNPKKSFTSHKRSNQYSCFLDIGRNERVQVCKPFYLGTLSISQKKVYTTHSNKTDCETPKPNGRGKGTLKKGSLMKSRMSSETT